jgi:GT2 family glycosyltransferase
MLSVVVLVVGWNGRDWLPVCLRALQAQQFAGRWAVLVVDNGSTDSSPDLVRTEFPSVALITNPTNLGFAGGNNVGIRALLDGTVPGIDFVPDIVVLLNQDTEVAPDWLINLAAPFDRDPQVGIVGCKLVFPDGTLQHAGGTIVWPLATGTHRGTGEVDTGQYDHASAPDYVAARSTPARVGHCWLVRRRLYARVLRRHRSMLPGARSWLWDRVHAARRRHAPRKRIAASAKPGAPPRVSS